MRRNWEECPRVDTTGRWSALYVTMNSDGHIVLSRRTFERVGSPEAFLLLFDRLGQIIGLKPAHTATRNAYPAAKIGRHGGRVIRALQLKRHFGIHVPETVRFVAPEIDEDGVLLLNLRDVESGAKVRGRQKATEAGDGH